MRSRKLNKTRVLQVKAASRRKTDNVKYQALISVSLILCLALLLFSIDSRAADRQDLDEIRNAAKNYVEGQYGGGDKDVEIEVGHVDRRLRLRQCQFPLEAFSPAGHRRGGNLTVGVRCDDQKPWKIYVPVRIRSYAQVLVTTRPMSRNSLIGPGDVALERRDISRLRQGFLSVPAEAIGQKLQRTLNAGAALTPKMLAADRVVKRGQTVTIIAKSASLEVRMSGKALSNGAIGERIRIKNNASSRIVEGVVRDSQTVVVRL